MQKKKLINYRIMFLLVVLMIVSIILTAKFFVDEKVELFLILFLSLTLIVLLILFFIFKKKNILKSSVFVLFFLLPIVLIYFTNVNISNNINKNAENNCFYGKIYNINQNLDEEKVYLYLTNIVSKNENGETKFNGNIIVFLNANNVDLSKLEIGKFVTINKKLTFYSLSDNSNKSLSYLSKGITASVGVGSYQINIEDEKSINLRENIKSEIYNIFKNQKSSFSDVGYAMIFGDSSILDSEVKNVFTSSGIAHLLAVSGFHISIIVLFISFLLNKLKANKYIKVVVIAAILLFYAYICGFSVSVIRASLMALLSLYATVKNKEYDILSALSFVAILILLISPLNLFNISFILSFTAVLSIILLAPIFTRLFSKLFYQKFASSLAVTLSASLGILISQLYYFGCFPILSVISNFVTIPIISIAYIFILIVTIFACLFSFVVPAISLFGYIIKYVLQFNSFISKAGFVVVSGELSGIVLPLFLITMFVFSDYVFLNKKLKTILVSLLVVILMGVVVF